MQPKLLMEGEGKKNSFTTRQHVLLPVFVSTYYVLPVGKVVGNFKKKHSSVPKEKIPSYKEHKQRVTFGSNNGSHGKNQRCVCF